MNRAYFEAGTVAREGFFQGDKWTKAVVNVFED